IISIYFKNYFKDTLKYYGLLAWIKGSYMALLMRKPLASNHKVPKPINRFNLGHTNNLNLMLLSQIQGLKINFGFVSVFFMWFFACASRVFSTISSFLQLKLPSD
ncbi:MAG: hypothetical protein ACRCR2_00970, partial [Fusobacteriaceae bacterium]